MSVLYKVNVKTDQTYNNDIVSDSFLENHMNHINKAIGCVFESLWKYIFSF